MFKELSEIMGKATISLTIQKTGANELTVGITPKTEGSDLVPAVMTGSPEDLDKGFAQGINGLVQDAEALFLKSSAQKQSSGKKAAPAKKDDKGTAKKPAAVQTSLVDTKPKEEAPKAEPKPVETKSETKAPDPVDAASLF